MMKKNTTRQLLRDLKAATLLGQPEAVDIALNGLLAFPGVAANDRMNDGFIEQVILPVGEALVLLKTSHLRPLLDHQLAAGRAVGAVSLANQYMLAKEATTKDLRKPANDTRLDVRKSLGMALFSVGVNDPEKLLKLGTSWLKDTAPRPRFTALIFIPVLAESHGNCLISLFNPLRTDPDYEVRAALVKALSVLARTDLAESVLELLTVWAAEAQPNAWVISRVLSASWAADHPAEVTAILRELSSKAGTSSQVKSAVEALARHGVEIQI